MGKLTIEEQIQVIQMLAENGIKVEALNNLNLKIQDIPLDARKSIAKILIHNGNEFSKLLSSNFLSLDELTENEIAMFQGHGARYKFWGKNNDLQDR